MTIQLELLTADRLPEFKKEMQRAFQLGAEAELGSDYMEVLPEVDIDRSLNSPGAVAYAAVKNGERSAARLSLLTPKLSTTIWIFSLSKSDGRARASVSQFGRK